MGHLEVMVVSGASAWVSPSGLIQHRHRPRGQSSGELSCDPRRFRTLYPDRWTAFLKAHFGGPAHVAAFFDVDPKTARNWWEGTSGPQGWAVEYAHQRGLEIVK